MPVLSRTASSRCLLFAALVLSLSLTSCSSGSSSNGSPSTPSNPAALAAGGASTVFIIGSNGTSVQSFSLSGSGTAATTLTLPSGFAASAIAVDTASSTLYVGGSTGTGTGTVSSQILAYPVSASGAATPARTILEGAGNFFGPAALAVDASGQLYVNSAVEITVFAANASGAATPVQLINGALTQFTGGTGEGIAVDSAHNIYASLRTTVSSVTTSNIYVFANGATGNVAPSRVIAASQPWVFGPAVDASQNVYAVQEQPSSTNANASIVKYSAGASGAATPALSISGGPISFLGGLLRDGVGNLYVLNTTSSGSQILGYGPNATGTVTTPGLSLSLSGTTAFSAQIAVQ